MWEFAKRFLSGWAGITLAVATIAGGLSIRLLGIPWGYLVVGALVVALIASYRLFDEQEGRIAELDDEVWSARNGTSLLVRCQEMPVWSMSGGLSLDYVYVVNRRKDHHANVSFALVAADGRMEASRDGNPNVAIPSPADFNPGANRGGQVSFNHEGFDLTPFVIEGVRLNVRDEQTGFTADIALPTGPDGIELIQRRENG